MTLLWRALVSVLLMLLLAACDGSGSNAPPSEPQVLSGDDLGYFCSMIVAAHEGPKAQVILDNKERALWFTSVRDAAAFMRLPGEPKNVAAIYVTDMGSADWAHPENSPNVWIEARDAWFVIESSKAGGMGAAEAVPFRESSSADAFAAEFGGRVVSYAELPEGYILSSR